MTIRRRTLAAFGLALLLAGSVACAAPPAKSYPVGRFIVGSMLVLPAHILDARALPDMQGKPSVMVTLDAKTATAIVAATKGTANVSATLDGKSLGSSPVAALAGDHVLQLSGEFGDYDSATALARSISGKDPLPETEGDE